MPKRQHRPGEHWLAQRADSPYWYCCWYDPTRGKTRWQSTALTDQGGAKRWLSDFLRDKVGGTPSERPVCAPPNDSTPKEIAISSEIVVRPVSATTSMLACRYPLIGHLVWEYYRQHAINQGKRCAITPGSGVDFQPCV